MKKMFTIARFEFLEKVRTRAFVIFMIVFPLVIIATSIIPTLLIDEAPESISPIGVLDETQLYSQEMIERLGQFQLSDGQPSYLVLNLNRKDVPFDQLQKEADHAVLEGNINGYISIKKTGQDSVSLIYRSRALTSSKDLPRFEKVFNNLKTSIKLQQNGFDPEVVNSLLSSEHIKEEQIAEAQTNEKNNGQTLFLSSIVFLMLLFMMILFSGGLLIRSVVEEKSNRIIEILLSSCSANQLLAGKIMGLGLLGIFQIAVWALIALVLVGGKYIPPDVFHNIVPAGIFFILGYMFYTAIFVGVGSVVTTEQEAQHFTGYLSLILILPLVIAVKVIQSPDLWLVKVLSYFPLTSPPIMLLRLNIVTPPLWELIVSAAVLLVSIYITVYISAKFFRIGILSYGKRPDFKELIQWLKEE